MKKISKIMGTIGLSICTVVATCAATIIANANELANSQTPKSEKDITSVLKNVNGCSFTAGVASPKESQVPCTGVEVFADNSSSSFTYNGIVNLAEIDNLISFMFTPTKMGTPELSAFKITLTDIYDVNNYLTMDFVEGTKWGYPALTYVQYCWSDKYTPCGINYTKDITDPNNPPNNGEPIKYKVQESGTSVQLSYAGFIDGCNYRPVTYRFDVEENSIYSNNRHSWAGMEKEFMVFNFTDTDIVGANVFEGFTTNEVYVTVDISAAATGAHVFMTEFCGIDLSETTMVDGGASISVNPNGYDLENLPFGLARDDATYPIFESIAYNPQDGEFAVEEIKVTRGIESIPIIDGRFATKESGLYIVKYSSTCENGVVVTRHFQIIVKDEYDTRIDYVFNEDIPDTIQLGEEKIYLPNGEAIGGFGRIDIECGVFLNGQEVKVQKESIVDYFVINGAKEGDVYELTYTLTDITGISQKFTKEMTVVRSEKPVILETTVPKAVRVGYPFKFTAMSAVLYKLDGGCVEVPVKIRVNGEFLSDTLVWSAPNEGDNTVELIAYHPEFPNNLEKANVITYKVKGLKLNEEVFFSSYFLGDNIAYADAAMQSMRFVAGEGTSSLTFANSLAAENFSIEWDLERANSFAGVRFILTDKVSPNIKVVLDVRNENSLAVLYVNNQKTNILTASFASNDGIKFSFAYSNKSLVVSQLQNKIATVEYTQRGDVFKGFTSREVYLDIECYGVKSGGADFTLYSINQQVFSEDYVDMKAPNVYFAEEIASIEVASFNTKFKIPTAYAYDVISDIQSLTMKITTPSGNVIYSGSAIEYEFLLDEYGEYKIAFEVRDTAGRKNSFTRTIEVKDEIAPTISGALLVSNIFKVGDKAELPAFNATDNLDKEVTKYYVVIDSDGGYHVVRDGGYTFTRKGTFIIRCVAVDDNLNTSYVQFSVEVK